ncbi:hypothetical protein [Mycobacterium tuberculosis]|uniref:hypothetical protein n=1 Tax=Mycobacterium tuberculosis TaxID=1773 RepID=UPI00272D9827|nr:hypothetical protein [Mycobacterium tuberculosis]
MFSLPFGGQATSAASRGLPSGVAALPWLTAARSCSLGYSNLSSNLSAILLFAFKGHVWWHLALPLALANVVGIGVFVLLTLWFVRA